MRPNIKFKGNTLPALNDLRVRKAKAIFRKAHTKGSGELRKDLKIKVPIRTGTLKKSIGNKVTQRNNRTTSVVGPRKEINGELDGQPVTPWRYFHLIDQGTKYIEAGDYAKNTWAAKGETFKQLVDQTCQAEYRKALGG